MRQIEKGENRRMKHNIVMETQDLTYLKWSHIRSSSGTAGTFLKSESEISGKKIYYKLSNFDTVNGVIAIDYLILNRDRHGANIEILRNPRIHSVRIAPFFDHGLSLLYSCMSDEAAEKFDIMEDKRCQNFIGGYSCFQNLELIKGEGDVFSNKLKESDRGIIFEGLETLLSDVFMDKIWNMIYERYQVYENL